MSHIFISYSRKDFDFAGKIVQALADNKLDTWIDWKSIPKGEDWEQEIYRGIEEADAFLLLISPDSVASEMCNKEIDHAVKNGKRILPIVIRDADPKIIHPEISKRNWIFCRDGQDLFKKAIAEIHVTIRADFDWLKYHTKLQAKALEWDRKKDTSRLLRGKELREVEQQLAGEIGQKDPKPTHLQQQYIWASKRDETRRKKILITTSLVASIVVVALVIYGSLQAKYANEKAEIAHIEEISGFAKSQTDKQLDVALLLSVEAFKRLDNYQTRNTLLLALQASPHIRQFYFDLAQPSGSGSFSKDGKLFASAYCDKFQENDCKNVKIKLWNIFDQELLGEVSAGDSKLVGRITFSSDSRLFAFSSCKDFGEEVGCLQEEISIWEVSSQKLVRTFFFETRVSFLGFHPMANWLIVAGCGKPALYSCGQGKIVVVDIDTGKIITEPTIGYSDDIWDAAISPDGNILATANANYLADSPNDHTITLWDLRSGQTIGAPLLGHTGLINSLAFSPDGRFLASGGYDMQLIIWDIENQSTIGSPLIGHSKQINSVSFSADGKRIASGSDDKNVILWDMTTRQMISRPLNGHSAEVQEVFFSPDNLSLFSIGKEGTIVRWDITNKSIIAKSLLVDQGSVSALSISSDGKTLISGGCHEVDKSRFDCQTGQIIFWDLTTRQILGQPQLIPGDEVEHIVISPDSRKVAATTFLSTTLWDMQSRQQIGPDLPGDTAPVFSPDSKVLAVGRCGIVWTSATCIQGEIILADSDNGQMITSPVEAHTNYIATLSYSRNGRILVSSSFDDIIFWDVGDDQSIHKAFTLDNVSANQMAFTPDDKTIVLAGNQNITFWDVASMQQISPHIEAEYPYILAIDGNLLVSGNRGNGIELWDVSSISNPLQLGQAITSFNSPITGVALSKVDNIVAFANCRLRGETNHCTGWEIILWSIDPNIWMQDVCDIVGRNLTLAEWKRFFSEESYRHTCPQWPAGE